MLYYMGWMRKYHWTIDDVDNSDLAVLLDLDLVELKVDDALNGKAIKYIDDIL